MFSCSITRMLLFLFCFLFGGKAAAEKKKKKRSLLFETFQLYG